MPPVRQSLVLSLLFVSALLLGIVRLDANAKSLGEQSVLRLSLSSQGTQANLESQQVMLSGDGMVAVFQSSATNLVPLDTNGQEDIFLRDVAGYTTERVSISNIPLPAERGSLHPSVSDDGQWITFLSSDKAIVHIPPAPNVYINAFLYNATTKEIVRISESPASDPANNSTLQATISPDGNTVALISAASNLVPGDNNGFPDLFLWNRITDEWSVLRQSPVHGMFFQVHPLL